MNILEHLSVVIPVVFLSVLLGYLVGSKVKNERLWRRVSNAESETYRLTAALYEVMGLLYQHMNNYTSGDNVRDAYNIIKGLEEN